MDLGGLTSFISPMLGGVSDFAGGVYANYANKKAAGEQMRFQGQMSSTAYRRAMADMKAAGLNPILASKLGGASSPSGAMAQFQNPVSSGINSAMNMMQTESNVELQDIKTVETQIDAILKANLIPGSEAISTLAKGAEDLVKWIDGRIRSEGMLDKAAESLGYRINDMMLKARNLGRETFNAVRGKLMDAFDKVSDETIHFFGGALKNSNIGVKND